MLTIYFSCYKLNYTSTTFHEEKNSLKLTDCQIVNVINVLEYSNIGVHSFQKERQYFLTFYTCIAKKSALVILDQRLHSIIKYVGCNS